MNEAKVVVGLLSGVAIGAIAGILFAPEKGSRTRRKIMNKGKDFSDEVKEKFEDLYEDITDKYETLLHDAKRLVVDGEERVK
jgi:gas vesicle protein